MVAKSETSLACVDSILLCGITSRDRMKMYVVASQDDCRYIKLSYNFNEFFCGAYLPIKVATRLVQCKKLGMEWDLQ